MPGEPVPVYIRRDFQITNAALGEELADESARTVVKVTHSPIPLNMMGDSDDEDYDDDMVVGSDEESDEDEEMEGEEDEEESEEGDEEEEGDSDDDSEDDSEDDFGEAEETVLCALTPGKIEQAQLNLTFIQGEVVVFQVSGPNAVHLMGNYIYQGGESDDEDDSDYSGSEFSDLDDEDEFDVEEFDEEIEVAPKGKITAVEEEKPKIKSFAAVVADKADTPKSAKADKKRKAEEEIEATPTKAEGELSKSQKKKLAKKAKLEGATESPAPKKETPKKEVQEEPKKDSQKVSKHKHHKH
jgi:FK506-binding nuclear protein